MIMNSDENNLFDDFGEIAAPPEIKIDKVANSPETQVIKEEVNEIIKKRKQMIYVDSSGKTRRGLSKEELIAAQSVCNTEIAVARLLRISYRTYIKYAKLHGVYGAVSTRPKIKLPPKTRKYKLEKILGNQYSLEESFDIEAVLENNSKVLSHFEQILKETVNSQKVGKGTRESVQIILDNMQNSQEERE